jgi:N-sulfoglucosamine sulfohydrolase
LNDLGVYDNTVIIALSDQGASFPMSKQSLYPYGLNLGLVIRWPGLTDGSTCSEMVSVTDIMPTVLDLLATKPPRPMDGRSVAHLLRGEQQKAGRTSFFTQYTFARRGVQVYPMRAIQTAEFLYIFNAWHNEVTFVQNKEQKLAYDGQIDPLLGLSWRSMKEASAVNVKIRQRVEFIRYRVPHELYDLKKDPYCLENLADRASHATQLADMKQAMMIEMATRSDPVLPKYQGTGGLPVEWGNPAAPRG